MEGNHLTLRDGHRMWHTECGNPNGLPLLLLHGGPGYHTEDDDLALFDHSIFRIIAFDQRGCGRSSPRAHAMSPAALDAVTTHVLVSDIEELRAHVLPGGKKAQWVVFGASWGSALAVLYALAHPWSVCGLMVQGLYLGSAAEHTSLFDGQHSEARALLEAACPQIGELWEQPLELHLAFRAQVAAAPEAEALRLWEQYENYVTYPDSRRHFLRQMQRTAAAATPTPDDDDVDQSLLQLRLFPEMMQRPQRLADANVLEALGQIPVGVVHGLDDDVCPAFVAQEFVAELRKRGPRGGKVHAQFVKDAPHMASSAGEHILAMGHWMFDQLM